MLDLARQRPLSHIGFDTEFGYDRPGVVIDKRNTAYDPRSIQPLLLSLSMVEPDDQRNGIIYTFVIDLRKPILLPILQKLFRLPVPFAGHYIKVEFFCLWRLELETPNIIWDTFIFEKLLHTGRYHHKYKLKNSKDELEEIRAKEESQEKKSFGYSLVATCQRYGVSYRMESQKERLQQSFLHHPKDGRFSQEQIDYAAEDAVAAGYLYPLQVQKAVQHALLHHCETVEMRWVITNARIEWNGIRVDVTRRDKIIPKIEAHLATLEKHITVEHGIQNIKSHKQLMEYFKAQGILQKFVRNGKVSFDKKMLKKNGKLHPVIELIQATRRARDLLSDKLLSPNFVGEDGRIRADHRQLGTDTGRQVTRWPNLLGLDRMLRPLIVPDPGCGIGEADWSQVEVGVAAAVYGDEQLIQMFNSEDVYSAMARHFFRAELSEKDLSLTGEEFKFRHKDLRTQMKSCTLGIIYGITPIGLARALGTSKIKAEALQKRFMKMFPQLQQALIQASQYGAIRGYANTISGLKRYRAGQGQVTRWEKNWLTNHPVQGSAAVVFKAAGNRLDSLYRQYGARIIIPLHDAFIFEAPLAKLEAVAELTSRVMCETLQEYFPELRPKVDVNISNPSCWNKDGDSDALERWIEELNLLMRGDGEAYTG